MNGTNIGVEEFQERVKVRTDELQQMYGQRGMTLPEGYVSRINQEVYDQMVIEYLLSERNLKNWESLSAKKNLPTC